MPERASVDPGVAQTRRPNSKSKCVKQLNTGLGALELLNAIEAAGQLADELNVLVRECWGDLVYARESVYRRAIEAAKAAEGTDLVQYVLKHDPELIGTIYQPTAAAAA